MILLTRAVQDMLASYNVLMFVLFLCQCRPAKIKEISRSCWFGTPERTDPYLAEGHPISLSDSLCSSSLDFFGSQKFFFFFIFLSLDPDRESE